MAPPAFLMGFPMPTAMTTLGRLGKDHMFLWAWGINGCFSVIGAAAVPLVATAFGLSTVLTHRRLRLPRWRFRPSSPCCCPSVPGAQQARIEATERRGLRPVSTCTPRRRLLLSNLSREPTRGQRLVQPARSRLAALA